MLVGELLARGKTLSEIASALGIAKSTACYHKQRLGRPMKTECARRYDWEAIQRYYDLGHSKRKCQEKFGFSSKSWTDAVRRGAVFARPQAMPVEQLLIANVTRGRHNMKSRLVSAGLKANRCEECGISAWRGRPLSLALHHRNGDGRDNRLENLSLLCPNCHSQTENFGVKNHARERSPAIAAKSA